MKISLTFLLPFFFLGIVISTARSDERILQFDSRVVVHEDGSISVTERIRVRSMGMQIKRGIFRDFPTRYKDRLGNEVVVGFEVTKVERDGRTEPYHVEDVSNGKRVYIGSAKVYLRPGEYSYAMTYRTTRQLGFFTDFDELYWNVTGNGWMFPIDRASATVTLPHGASAELRNAEAFTGPQGARDCNYETSRDAAGNIRFVTTKALPPYHGFTIVVAWPKGYVQEPTEMERLLYFFGDNLGATIGVFGLIILALYYLAVWMKVGVDPAKGTIIPQFSPPGNLSPAAVRFISKMKYDQKIFAATLIQMAVKGYLTINERDGTYTVNRREENESALSPIEKYLSRILFSSRSYFEFKDKNYQTVSEAINGLKQILKRNYEVFYFVTNRQYFITGLLLSIGTGLFTILFSPSLGEALFATVWLSIWSMGVAFLLVRVVSHWKRVAATRGKSTKEYREAVVMTLFSLPFVVGEVVGFYFLGQVVSGSVIAFLLVLAALNYTFYRLLKAPTRAGRKLLDRIEGFKMYLATAEKDRLNMLNPPERTPELFERYLPYALALGVEQQWSEQFAEVIAGIRDGRPAYSPAWYAGSHWNQSSFSSFGSSLGSSFSGAISSSSSPPGSSSGGSGGGGGGSSGGGGGGGGGGGW